MSGPELRRAGHALDMDHHRVLVPEPVVKRWLAARGVAVPRAGEACRPGVALAVKAFGPGIVHKSDLGGLRVGVGAADVATAQEVIRADLASHAVAPDGFLVEEMVPAGVEVIVGVVAHPVFGPVLAVGMGGVLAEVMRDVALRVLPVTASDVEQMIDELRSSVLLAGARGAAAVDRHSLVELVLGLVGAAGELGSDLAELECNPVIVSPSGAVAADARLVLHAETPPPRPRPPETDFSLLFEPRGVAVVGGSTTRSSFGNWILDAMRNMGRPNLAAIHPTAEAIEGVPAYPSLSAVPHEVDYVLAAVPAAACPALVADAERARFVHVISGGFREAGAPGEGLEADLMGAARRAGVRVLGPNCMGTFSPAGRLAFQLDVPAVAGRVAVISQSGGLAADIIKVGDARGMRFSKLVTVGNAVDVTHGELLDWLVDDPGTDVVGLYVEDPRDGAGLVAALRRARGRVPVVALIGGLSAQGARAVASHTGALAGDEAIWRGISAATGMTCVRTFEELIGALRYLERHCGHHPATSPNVLIAGVGGGATVLAADACDRAGLTVELLGDGARAALSARGYGVGTSIANPIEIPVGPGVAPDLLASVLGEVLDAQGFSDVLVHMNVQQYFSFVRGGSSRLIPFVEAIGSADLRGARLALVVRNAECAPTDVRARLEVACAVNDLATFVTFEEAAVAIGAAQRFERSRGA